MVEKTERLRLMHGVLKGAVKSIIDLVHHKIPKEDLVTDGKNKPRQPELANLCSAFNVAIKDKQGMNVGMTAEESDKGSPQMVMKAKEIGLSVLASDSAYYHMAEFALKEYCHIKMDHAFGHDAVEKAWFDQWNTKFEELKKQKEEEVSQ